MKRGRFLALWLCAVLLLAACGGAAETAAPTEIESIPETAPTATEAMVEATDSSAPEPTVEAQLFEISTSAYGEGEVIPDRYACTGEDVSPDLAWGDPPEGTQTLALLFDDLDAFGWVHWLAYNLPPDLRGLDEGQPAGESLPAGGLQGATSWGSAGYRGPCPPAGAPHSYVFTLYALDAELELEAGATVEEFQAAIEGHVLAETQYTGEFSR